MNAQIKPEMKCSFVYGAAGFAYCCALVFCWSIRLRTELRWLLSGLREGDSRAVLVGQGLVISDDYSCKNGVGYTNRFQGREGNILLISDVVVLYVQPYMPILPLLGYLIINHSS